MSRALIPLLAAAVTLYGLSRGYDVYAAFLQGVRKGLKTMVSIFPAMLAMLTALAMVRASGATDVLAHGLAPLLAPLGVPAECVPLALLRPFSGSGALALGADVIRQAGPESPAGLIAAVMLGSSETSVYCVALYSASVGAKTPAGPCGPLWPAMRRRFWFLCWPCGYFSSENRSRARR